MWWQDGLKIQTNFVAMKDKPLEADKLSDLMVECKNLSIG
jgi:hypothetical protein